MRSDNESIPQEASVFRRAANSRRLQAGLLFGFVIAMVPLLGLGSYDLFRVELVLLYASAAMGLSIVVGFAGQLLLSQAAVIAVSAFVTAYVDLQFGWQPLLILPIAIATGVAVGVITGSPGIRVGGLYLGIISFFAVAILPDLATLTEEWSGGEAGLSGISRFRVFDYDPRWLSYEMAAAVLVLTYFGLRRLVRSGFGLRLTALRDTPQALVSSGVSLGRTKFASYVVAAVPCSLVGWLFPYINRSVGYQFFGLSFTLLLLAAVELSGRGTLLGAAIAAAVLQTYSIGVGPFSKYNTVGLGLVLLVPIILFPRGLAAVLPTRLMHAITGAPKREPDASAIVDLLIEPFPLHEEALVQVSGVSKSFGGNRALTDVSLALTPGRIVGLIGGNGSGKTTLINIVTGHLRADTGQVGVGGEDVSHLRPDQIARRGVSRTFQLPQLIEGATVRRNVEVGLLGTHSSSWFSTIFRFRRADRIDRERAARAENALRLIGDEDLADQVVDVLPLGMKRVVEVARVLAGGAQVVLLDEPASGLSEQELKRLATILSELRGRGHAVLFVEHNVGFVMQHCDEVVLLSGGQVVARHLNGSGTPLPAELHEYLQHVPSLRGTTSAAIPAQADYPSREAVGP